jgi:ribosomal protein L37AE/L43A
VIVIYFIVLNHKMAVSSMMAAAVSGAPDKRIMTNFMQRKQYAPPVEFSGVYDARNPVDPRGNMEAQIDARLADQYPNTIADLNTPVECKICKQRFLKRDNVGQWRCSFHWGYVYVDHTIVDSPVFERWSCCGDPKTWDSVGCKACDHNHEQETWDNRYMYLLIPQFMVRTKMITAPIEKSLLSAGTINNPQWVAQEIRHVDDIRDGRQEEVYGSKILGPVPVVVRRVDGYGRKPLRFANSSY